MKPRSSLPILAGLLIAGACAPAAQTGMIPAEETISSAAMETVMPGSVFAVQLDQAVVGATGPHLGDEVTATVIEPLRALDGATAIPAGAQVRGTVEGYYPGGGVLPAMVSIVFNQVQMGDMMMPIEAQVVHVDLAIGDDGPTYPAGIVSLANASEVHPGLVIAHADEYLLENELGPEPANAISLGHQRGSSIPAGARLTLELSPRAMG